MADFKFKIPELPEDVLHKRRKTNNYQLSKERQFSGNDSWRNIAPPKNQFIMQGNQFNSFYMRNCAPMQSIRESIEEDHVQPSTSKQMYCSNPVQSSMIERPFKNFKNQTFSGGGGGFHSISDTLSNMSGYNHGLTHSSSRAHASLGGELFRDNVNLNLCKNNKSLLKSSVNNCFQVNQSFKGIDASDFYDLKHCSSNMQMQNSTFNRQSIFSRSLLPQRNCTGNNFRNQVNFRDENDTVGSASILRNDKNISNVSFVDQSSMMKSILKISHISVRNKILNKLETFAHSLLRQAPDLGASFLNMTKEVESIFETDSYDQNEMFSTVICASAGNQQQKALENVVTNQENEIEPRNIINQILSKNDTGKLKFITSHSIEKRKSKKGKDECDNELSFTLTPVKNLTNGEINLKDWYPVARETGLAFVGKNEENKPCETKLMKKRITNRKILLSDGSVCNLIGNPSNAPSYLAAIKKFLKDGIHIHWRLLTNAVVQYQSKLQKENAQKKKDDMLQRDITLSTPFKPSTRAHPGKLIVEKSTKSPSSITKKKNNLNDSKMPIITKNKISSNKNNKSLNDTKDATPKLRSKTPRKSCSDDNDDDDDKNGETSRVLCTTRRGRIVKRPIDMWFGNSFNSNVTKSEHSTTIKNIKGKSPINEEQTDTHPLKRKGVAPKTPVEAKKTKVEGEPLPKKQQTRKEKNKKGKGPKAEVVAKGTPAAAKRRKCRQGKENNENKFEPIENNPWGNEIDEGLDGIYIPKVCEYKEIKTDANKLKILGAETPPLQLLRNNMKIFNTCTPVQSPDWQVSQRTRSEVKKFEKLRAQTFKKKIPKENRLKSVPKKNTPRNKDVATIMNWVTQKDVKSPAKCSKVLKYVLPKKVGLEDNESEDETEINNTLGQ